MQTLIKRSLNALEIAGSLCGVPYVGAAAIVLQDIVRCCEDVAIHKRQLNQLVNKCATLLCVFDEQRSKLEQTALQAHADEVTQTLEKVYRSVSKWSQYGRVKTFYKSADIERGIESCSEHLTDALSVFQIQANINIHGLQYTALEESRRDTAELRELARQILTNQKEMQHVAMMQRKGEHVAEPLMEIGQLAMQQLRRRSTDERMQELITDRQLTSSPTPYGTSSNSSIDTIIRPQEGGQYLQFQRGLINLHNMTGIPPTIKKLNGEIRKMGDLAVAGGTYSDIWLGTWLGTEKVALKALRNIKSSDPKAQKHFVLEINVWAKLKNDRILPFYGIVTDLGPQIHMVSPWQEHGNVLDYVKNYPTANKIELLADAAQGLKYLHSCDVIHGNVKCANILVSATGRACICDFGMSKIIEEVTETSASVALTSSGSARWLAPELIEGLVNSPTKASDTYSYAMAILELITGKHPYAKLKRDATVIRDVVVCKKIPERPSDEDVEHWLVEPLWSLMQECWCSAAEARPPMSEVAARMGGIRAAPLTDVL